MALAPRRLAHSGPGSLSPGAVSPCLAPMCISLSGRRSLRMSLEIRIIAALAPHNNLIAVCLQPLLHKKNQMMIS